ncbi:MAG: acyltransferase family protein [Flavobacteriales bacterium]
MAKKIYFKGLAELRAIAALSVLFHHIELYKKRDNLGGLYDTWLNYFIHHLGKNGVYIFFVLSGFLITYLLLSEKTINGKIHIKKFYFRRILRIWPLYYLIVFISFVIIPFLANNFEFLQNETTYYTRILALQEAPYFILFLLIFMLPNLALHLRTPVVGAAQSWSVGVEEQFYIIWPHVIQLISNKKALLILLFLLSLVEVIPSVIYPYFPWFSEILTKGFNLFPIHFMAIGGIGAVLLFYFKVSLENILIKPIYYIINSILLLIIMAIDFHLPFRNIIFGYLVLAQILFIISDKFKYNLRSTVLEKIGSISYGVYMYHPLCMYICFATFNSIFPLKDQLFIYNIAVYLSVLTTSYIISSISFKYFERKFIALKNKKFTIIKSGKN